MKRAWAFVLAFVMLFGSLPPVALITYAEETAGTAPVFEGKTVSVLGNSSSTFAGISDDTSGNATLSGGALGCLLGRYLVEADHRCPDRTERQQC